MEEKVSLLASLVASFFKASSLSSSRNVITLSCQSCMHIIKNINYYYTSPPHIPKIRKYLVTTSTLQVPSRTKEIPVNTVNRLHTDYLCMFFLNHYFITLLSRKKFSNCSQCKYNKLRPSLKISAIEGRKKKLRNTIYHSMPPIKRTSNKSTQQLLLSQ